MYKFAIINGPNLNLLGAREPAHYGQKTLQEIENELFKEFKERANLSFFQSNAEGDLIDYLQSLKDVTGIIINPGALTHTSIALRDALIATMLPAIEVHLSNVYAREPFRHHSYFSDICCGVISGLGPRGYALAVDALLHKILEDQSKALKFPSPF